MVHVAGTKGKGSTIHFISSILRASGLNVGSYTRYCTVLRCSARYCTEAVVLIHQATSMEVPLWNREGGREGGKEGGRDELQAKEM